ncbi:efflux transporter outer membrane subunit, partial [bacterium]|nr:efflux transporter outer membrane subunit [bacterium]
SRDAIQASVDVDTGTQGRSEFGEDEDASASADLFGSFSVVWPVDVSGRVENQVAAARAEVEGASAALRGVILAVSADVTSEYLRLRGNQRQLALLKESVELQKQTLAIVQSRYEAGLAPELDLKRAEAAVASLQADIPPLEEKLINSRNRLATLTGHFPGKYEKLLKEEKGIPTYQSQIPTMLPMRVLTLRPDIRQAEAELKRAVAEIGVAEAEWYPTVQLIKQMRLGTTGISEGPTLGILVGSIGVLIQQVLSDGGAREAQLAIAESQAKETLARYRENLIVAMEEVEFSLAALASSLDRQKSLAQAVEASNRSFFQAESLYRQGLTSFIDVVDAQRVLASAQQKLASAKTNYASQIAHLFYVLGTDVTL